MNKDIVRQSIVNDAIQFIRESASFFAQLPLHFKDSVPESVRKSYESKRDEANRLSHELPKRWNATVEGKDK